VSAGRIRKLHIVREESFNAATDFTMLPDFLLEISLTLRKKGVSYP
jgi:hypothetical protein